MTIYYFTATGNSLAVAKQIGGTLISIPQVMDSQNQHYEDDVIGLVFPIYNLGLPSMVKHFLDGATFEADYMFAVGTYGNMPGPAMYNLQKLAKNRGYRFDYAKALRMLDNFLPVFEVDTEVAKLPSKQVEENLATIVSDIQNRTKLQATVSLPVRALASVLGVFGNTERNAQSYIVNEQCNQCGTCAKVCPAKNIAVTDKVHFSNHCEACLACVHLCPQNAIHLKNEKSVRRWINPEVALSEIMIANNRTDISPL